MNVMSHKKKIITTTTAIIPTTTMRSTLPVKHDQEFDKPHEVMSFANEEDFQTYLECGQLKDLNVSPCVGRSALNNYPMVFEELQVCNSKTYGCNGHSKCKYYMYI